MYLDIIMISPHKRKEIARILRAYIDCIVFIMDIEIYYDFMYKYPSNCFNYEHKLWLASINIFH